MKYIKIKVKHIFLALAILTVIYALIPFAYSKIGRIYKKKGKLEYAAVYYKKALSMTPDFFRSGKDIYDYASILSGGAMENSVYHIFPYGHGGSTNNKVPTEEALNTAISQYKNLMENHSHDPWAKWGYIRLAEIYLYLGDYEEAEKYLLAGKANADANLIYTLYNSSGEYQKGIMLLEDLIKNNNKYFDMNYYDCLAQLYIQSGKYDKALDIYMKALDKEHDVYDDGSARVYMGRKEELKAKIERVKEMKSGREMGQCKGRVTVDGVGVEGVRVYIKDKSIYKEEYLSSVLSFPFVITDKDGYYCIDNVLPGEYDIGIGIRPDEILGKAYLNKFEHYEKILEPGGTLVNDFKFNTPMEILSPDDKAKIKEDKLEIKWQGIEKAESYGLIIGVIDESSYVSSVFKSDIEVKIDKDINSTTMDINQLLTHFLGFKSYCDDGKPSPRTLLGVYGGTKILYGIEAYDKNGNLIGSSMPIIQKEKAPRHFVFVSEELEGDKLVKEEKYEEAKEWFEDYLAKNPEDVHALYVLARYYENYEKDLDKAKEYMSRLYEITNNEEYKKYIERMFVKE